MFRSMGQTSVYKSQVRFHQDGIRISLEAQVFDTKLGYASRQGGLCGYMGHSHAGSGRI